MPKTFLKAAFVRNSVCPSDRRTIDYFDTAIPGFMLEVRQAGGRTFYLRYHDSRGRDRQFKLGSAKAISARAARQKAKTVLAQITFGSDPQDARRILRAIPTLRVFVRDSYLPFAQGAKRSWRTDETILRLHILPSLGYLALDQITSQAVAAIVRKLKDRGYASGTTNRVVILLRYIFNRAKEWGTPGSEKNPTKGLKTEADVSRERYLSAEETVRLLQALDADENQIAAQAIKLLLLTGARRNEITHSKWEHVDRQNKTLLVPLSKSGKPRFIHLNSAAIALLRSIQPLPDNAYIFPSPGTGRPSPSLHFPWTRIRKRAGLTGFRLHDLRHSFASFLVNEGVSIYVVQGLLGHANVRATQRYAHLANKTLSDAVEIIPSVILQNNTSTTLSDQIATAA